MELIRRFWRANKFPVEALSKYLKFATTSELLWDIGLPFILSVSITGSLVYLKPGAIQLISSVQSINNQVLTAISILAGFSIASLTLLASTDSKLVERIRETKSTRFPEITIFEMLLSFFQWAVVSQLLIIFLGILILFVTSLWTPIHHKWHLFKWEVFVGLSAWLACICHVVMASIRNLKMTMVFILNKHDKR